MAELSTKLAGVLVVDNVNYVGDGRETNMKLRGTSFKDFKADTFLLGRK